jgi:hypothetical protein
LSKVLKPGNAALFLLIKRIPGDKALEAAKGSKSEPQSRKRRSPPSVATLNVDSHLTTGRLSGIVR